MTDGVPAPSRTGRRVGNATQRIKSKPGSSGTARFCGAGTKVCGSALSHVQHAEGGNIPMRTKLLAAAALAAFVTPALAAEFYVVQDTSSKRCTIVEQLPTTQTT